MLRARLLQRYNNYFQHWRDFSIVLAFFAISGLWLTIRQWEDTFNRAFRDPNYNDPVATALYTNLNISMSWLILLTTIVSLIVCFTKHFTRQVWQEYKNPMAFYMQLVQK